MSEADNTPIAEEIHTNWKTLAAKLSELDGSSTRFPYGGLDLKNNPPLQATLNEIAESFIPSCIEKAAGFDREHTVKARARKMHISYDQDDRIVTQIFLLQEERKALDDQLLHLEDQAMERLLNTDSGIEQEVRRRVSRGAAEDEGLRSKTAKDVLSLVIHTLVDCCVSHLQGTERKAFVPFRSMKDGSPSL